MNKENFENREQKKDSLDFIRLRVAEDLKAGKNDGKVARFQQIQTFRETHPQYMILENLKHLSWLR